MEACSTIDNHTTDIGTTLLRELVSIGGRDRDEAQYEQLLQKMSEILVIERVVTCSWPQETTFEHEPAAEVGGPRPELVVNYEDSRLIVEVKTPALFAHIRLRDANPTQLAYRGGLSLEQAEELAGNGEVILPRDNPILDFLKDANRKFAGFRDDPNTSSLLVIIWDDFIYEPISTLVNQASGLLTENSFAKNPDGAVKKFPNIDMIVTLRHLNYFIAGSRDEPLNDRANAMDFGSNNSHPNVFFPAHGERQVSDLILEHLRAYFYDDPGLKVLAEYNPQDVVLWR